jgi:hypothetical protein
MINKPIVLFPALALLALVPLASCERAPVPSAAPALNFGTPSYAHLSDSGRTEAVVAFEHAKKLVASGAVDPQSLDLAHPAIFHECPGGLVDNYDWLVTFPRPASDFPVTIAVLNDGTCWVLR